MLNIVVLLRMVPDVVEELEIAPEGKVLETEWLRLILSDRDDHALEQALLLKEKYGGSVTVAAPEAPEIDDVLFTALAKGADRAAKISGDWTNVHAPRLAQAFGTFITASNLSTPDTLILTGSQAIDDLEGELAPYLAEALRIPYVGVVTSVTVDESRQRATVVEEFGRGLRGEFELPLPAVFGIQSAEKPPRYIVLSKVQAAMKTAKIETQEISLPETAAKFALDKLFKPEAAGRAEMLEGSPEQIAARMVEILTERGLM
jgi:electron transfer flavoprotein beta subunit